MGTPRDDRARDRREAQVARSVAASVESELAVVRGALRARPQGELARALEANAERMRSLRVAAWPALGERCELAETNVRTLEEELERTRRARQPTAGAEPRTGSGRSLLPPVSRRGGGA
jgi:hypothetical protein